jgi:tetratricopeptide (TPR) repeat protein
MGEEREVLVKRVFPKIRKLCEARGIAWSDVDLRWGIPDERSAEEHVLPVCLAEAAKCPVFLCMLGDRYGWVPGGFPKDALEQHPWLARRQGNSVTELEVWCALNRRARALFYFRGAQYAAALPPDKRLEFEESVQERRAKLAQLKARIRKEAPEACRDYTDPQAFADLVVADLTRVIGEMYPESAGADPLDREALAHETFARGRRAAYIGRHDYFDRLEAHAAGAGPPLVVTGDSGSGKSALLANWALAHREAHPEDFTLAHFIGASPHSAEWESMLRRITGELNRRFLLGIETPEQPGGIRKAFAESLHRAAAKGRVVLILDALNQLEDRDGAPDLVWLPAELPDGVRIVVSTLPGRALQELEKRECPSVRVEPLEQAGRQALIGAYLAQFGKELSASHRGRIAGAAQTGNPLYLKTLLAELRVYGDHATLARRIDHYLEAASVIDLYKKVLDRYEADYERDRPGLVGDAMRCVWAARHGLAESELLDLLGTGGNPLPNAYLSPLLLAADESLVSRAGLFGFGHRYLRDAVEERYVRDGVSQEEAHRSLAAYFENREPSARRTGEFPWQLMKAKDWPRLYRLLSDPEFFAGGVNRFDALAYWAEMETNSAFRMTEAYGPALENRSLPVSFLETAGLLLLDTGRLDACSKIQQALVQHFRKENLREALPHALVNAANVLQVRGELDRAYAVYEEAAAVCREVGDRRGLSIVLSNQGQILTGRGAFEQAMLLYDEQERICRELHDDWGLQSALRNKAHVLAEQGEEDEALELYEEQERVCRRCGNLAEIATALTCQAGILRRKGQLERAMSICTNAEQIAQSLGDRRKLTGARQEKAWILDAGGDHDGALALFDHCEEIALSVGDSRDLAECIVSRARILQDRGDLEGALAAYRRGEQGFRSIGVKDGLLKCLDGMAYVQVQLGRRDEAMARYQEQERICREIGHQRGLQSATGNIGILLRAMGDEDAAMERFREQERICRKSGNHSGLERSVGLQAEILFGRGEVDSAMPLYKEQQRLCVLFGLRHNLMRAVSRQAQILYRRGHFEGVLQLYSAHERYCREREDADGIVVSLNGQSLALAQMYQTGEALELAAKAAAMVEQSRHPELQNQTRANLELIHGFLEREMAVALALQVTADEAR